MKTLNLFQHINARITNLLLSDDAATRKTVAPERYAKMEAIFWQRCWYAWVFMLIPVSGMVGTYITIDNARRAAWRETK